MPQNEQDDPVESQTPPAVDLDGKTLEQQLEEWHEGLGRELVANLNRNVQKDSD
jgi:hypothetical protein